MIGALDSQLHEDQTLRRSLTHADILNPLIVKIIADRKQQELLVPLSTTEQPQISSDPLPGPFMSRVSSPLKQSYIPEIVAEIEDEEDMSKNTNDEEIFTIQETIKITCDPTINCLGPNSNQTPITPQGIPLKNSEILTEKIMATSREITGDENSEEHPVAGFPNVSISDKVEANQIDSPVEEQFQMESSFEEDQAFIDPDLQKNPKTLNTCKKESLFDPINRLKELLLAQTPIPDIICIPDKVEREYLAIKTHSRSGASDYTSTILVPESKCEYEDDAQSSIHSHSDISLLSNVSLEIPFSTKSIDEPSSSSRNNSYRELYSILKSSNKKVSTKNSTDGIIYAEKSPQDLFNRTKSFDGQSSTQSSLLDEPYYHETSVDDMPWRQNINGSSKKPTIEFSSGNEPFLTKSKYKLDFKKVRTLPVSLISTDIKELKSRRQKKLAYVHKTNLLQQEETGLAIWIHLNIKKEPSTLFTTYKSRRSKSTSLPPKMPNIYSNPSANSSISQPDPSLSLDSSEAVPPAIKLVPSLSHSSKSSKSLKSSKSSRISLDISIQTSSLRVRPNSPPSSPKPRTSGFLSLPGINRRTSMNNKITRAATFLPPTVMDEISATSSNTLVPKSLNSPSIPKSPNSPSMPKRQRRFSFQSVSSRFSFSNSNSPSVTTTIEETIDINEEKNSQVEIDDTSLNKLCDVLPHADRDVLQRYLQKAGGKDDLMAVGLYMKDLKSGEVEGI
ncbi:hypothetical protein G9A89_007710 [Geosiphon pyriformis]|nr:hypothetical protein G9A89_007710 [Geosiphon pyriformis]